MPCKRGVRYFTRSVGWRAIGYLVAVLNVFLMLAPPYDLTWELSFAPLVIAFGFLSLGRGYLFLHTWWFWLFGALIMFVHSGLKISFTGNRLPEDILRQISMVAGGSGAAFATLVGLQKLIVEITIKRAETARKTDSR